MKIDRIRFQNIALADACKYITNGIVKCIRKLLYLTAKSALNKRRNRGNFALSVETISFVISVLVYALAAFKFRTNALKALRIR